MKKFIRRLIFWAIPEIKQDDFWTATFIHPDGFIDSNSMREIGPLGPIKIILPKVSAGIVKTQDIPKETEMEVWFPLSRNFDKKTVIYGNSTFIKKLEGSRERRDK